MLLLPVLLAIDKVLGDIPGYEMWAKVVVGMMLFTPVYFLLTLRLQHQNLFALILLLFAGFLAVASKSQPALADRSTALSRVQHL